MRSGRDREERNEGAPAAVGRGDGTAGAPQRRRPDARRALGELGERLAAGHLEAAGYEIVERNFRTRYGELDIVAHDERFLVFVEVKTRVVTTGTSQLGPLAAIGHDKRRRLRLMAKEWLGAAGAQSRGPPDARSRRKAPAEIRFDAVGIVVNAGGRLLALDHVEDAF